MEVLWGEGGAANGIPEHDRAAQWADTPQEESELAQWAFSFWDLCIKNLEVLEGGVWRRANESWGEMRRDESKAMWGAEGEQAILPLWLSLRVPKLGGNAYSAQALCAFPGQGQGGLGLESVPHDPSVQLGFRIMALVPQDVAQGAGE